MFRPRVEGVCKHKKGFFGSRDPENGLWEGAKLPKFVLAPDLPFNGIFRGPGSLRLNAAMSQEVSDLWIAYVIPTGSAPPTSFEDTDAIRGCQIRSNIVRFMRAKQQAESVVDWYISDHLGRVNGRVPPSADHI
ncbi:hypothetical protein DFH09DRAFT_1100064 [Mycena vulgaris]|nr:hypothetical protein DFH09DRAFT_1100064 [Mycena vulgaris]